MAFVHGAVTHLTINDVEWSSVLREITLYRDDKGEWKILAEGYFDTGRFYDIQNIPQWFTKFELRFGSKTRIGGIAKVVNVKIKSELSDATSFRLSLSDIQFDNEARERVEIVEDTTLNSTNKSYSVVDEPETIPDTPPIFNPIENVKAASKYIQNTYGNGSAEVADVSYNFPSEGDYTNKAV